MNNILANLIELIKNQSSMLEIEIFFFKEFNQAFTEFIQGILENLDDALFEEYFKKGYRSEWKTPELRYF